MIAEGLLCSFIERFDLFSPARDFYEMTVSDQRLKSKEQANTKSTAQFFFPSSAVILRQQVLGKKKSISAKLSCLQNLEELLHFPFLHGGDLLFLGSQILQIKLCEATSPLCAPPGVTALTAGHR